MNALFKVCFKCQKEKPITAFYLAKGMNDGHLGKCIACTRKDAKEHRDRNIEKVRQYDRARGHREPDRRKELARRAVLYALRDGRLTRRPCEVCGESRTDAHHPDYDRPLEVRWLCEPHHGEIHRRYAA